MSPVLELRGVHKRFGKTAVINGVDLAVERGARHALIGPNGAGKSTLFNLITGRDPVSQGAIYLKGERITALTPYDIYRRGLARSFQVTNIFPRLSVFENIRCAVLWSLGHRYSFWYPLEALQDARERVENVLDRIRLGPRRDAPAGVLSYAEQRALELGITIAGGADVLLFDEPTAGMNRAEASAAVALIREISADKTLVIVEHDMSVVFDLADRITVLAHGAIIASGPPDAIRGDAAVREAYLGTAHV